jgi:hypothetical protein
MGGDVSKTRKRLVRIYIAFSACNLAYTLLFTFSYIYFILVVWVKTPPVETLLLAIAGAVWLAPWCVYSLYLSEKTFLGSEYFRKLDDRQIRNRIFNMCFGPIYLFAFYVFPLGGAYFAFRGSGALAILLLAAWMASWLAAYFQFRNHLFGKSAYRMQAEERKDYFSKSYKFWAIESITFAVLVSIAGFVYCAACI